MYIPKYFRNESVENISEFIEENGFAILINQVDNRPWATHLPLMLDTNNEGNQVLSGHISRANKQWHTFENDTEVLAIFNGPHAYISSSLYDHENVPTWNYQVVHVYGKIKIIEGDSLKAKLGKLMDKYEKNSDHPVAIDHMSEELLNREIKGIVGFEIEITDIQAASKLSQNRDEKNYKNIIDHLEKSGDPSSRDLAIIMKEQR